MDTEIKITAPVLDKSIIQKAAQEAATRAALREIEDYYCGFDSPYRKQLREYLQKNAPSARLDLPEFTELLSKSLSAEIENIVNKKCVESFAQEIRRAFSHLKEESDGTILLSTLAEDMMTYIDFDDPEYDNSFELEVRDGSSYNLKDVYVTISEDDAEKKYKFTLMSNGSDGTYRVLSMPYTYNDNDLYTADKKITLETEKCTISFPMFSGVSNDHTLLVLARCIMFDAHIRIDQDYISKDSQIDD